MECSPSCANPALGKNRRRSAGDAHEAVLLRVGQRAQQDGVDQSVDDGVGSDAERQREHGGEREARRLAHLAQRETNILQNTLGQGQRGAIAVGLAGLLCAAETDQGLATGFLAA